MTPAVSDRTDFYDNRINFGKVQNVEAGLTLYMDELQHYDIAVIKSPEGYDVVLKLNIGGIKHTQTTIPLPEGQARLLVEADNLTYRFYLVSGTGLTSRTELGMGYTKYLSSEVAAGFTGVMIGLYAIGNCEVMFTDFECTYHEI